MKIVELDHEVYERLQDLSIAFVEPNLSNVIKIIDKLNSSKKTKLPGKYYRKQIIKALEELGGRAHLEDVLELTFKRIRHVDEFITHLFMSKLTRKRLRDDKVIIDLQVEELSKRMKSL